MYIWQADFYRRPLKTSEGEPIWELLLCTSDRAFLHLAECSQSRSTPDWLAAQFRGASAPLPEAIHVFRPQALGLISAAAEMLDIPVKATPRTEALKQALRQRSVLYSRRDEFTGEAFNPIAVDRPPPSALPERLWGEMWRTASILAEDMVAFGDRPIPVRDLPEELLPLNLGIASSQKIPGLIIYGGKHSMRLARWLEEQSPIALNYIPTEVNVSGGFVLEAGLCDRWIMATFEDEDAERAGQVYEQQKQAVKGLHFLLVQPDDSGMTYSGFWLLQPVWL